MNDSKYWESQSAAMLREYRTLQGFMDVARNEGTPEMVEATSAAMGAVWRLVEECDRRANQESRRAAVDQSPVCKHQWEGRDGAGDYLCVRCGVWSASTGETAEEPPFDVQERAYERYDLALSGCSDVVAGAHGESGHCIRCARIANDPVHERQTRLGKSPRTVTLDGASPAYRASLERDASRAQELSAERMTTWAAQPRESDPLGAFFN